MVMSTFLLVCLGSALGGGLRYGIAEWMAHRFGNSFPLGTLLVNVSGCFVIGLLAAMIEPGSRFVLGPGARLFWMVGVLGGFTTFSSFSLQTLLLAKSGQWTAAGANIVLSIVLCLAMVSLGFTLGESLSRRP